MGLWLHQQLHLLHHSPPPHQKWPTFDIKNSCLISFIPHDKHGNSQSACCLLCLCSLCRCLTCAHRQWTEDIFYWSQLQQFSLSISATKGGQYDRFIKRPLSKQKTNSQKCDVIGHSACSNSLPLLIYTRFVLHGCMKSDESELTRHQLKCLGYEDKMCN